jgi:hypothetical protein
MFSILVAASRTGRHPTIEATSFAIISPDARRELDEKVMIGARWWNDDWWPAAEASGLLRIENHSWDHNHECLAQTRVAAPRGTFELSDAAQADAEIRAASDYLCTVRRRSAPVLFAYPYGDASDYIAREYLPRGSLVHGVRAAFTTDGMPVSRGADRWRLPRYVFRAHWKSEAELRQILRGSRPGFIQRMGRLLRHRGRAPAFRFEEIASSSPQVVSLFRRCFNAPPPDTPRHFVAVYATGEDEIVCGYVHHTPFDHGVFLVGGLCVDTSIYRRLPHEARAAVALQGSLSRWLLARSIAMLGAKRAVFAYTGNTVTRRDGGALGFIPARGPHLLVQWHDEPVERREDLVDRIERLGAF